MGSKKKRKRFLQDLDNPQILSLHQAFALRDQPEDPDDFLSNPDSDGRVVDAVLNRISTRYSGSHDIGALSYGERMMVEVTALMGEVINGGFHQYLWNSSGDSAEFTRTMLRDLGAIHTADLLDRVSAFFPHGRVPEDRRTRCEAIEQFEDANPDVELFDEEDRMFYRSNENLYTLMVAYIRSHEHEFAEPSDEIVKKFKRRQPIREHFGVAEDPKTLEQAEEALQAFQAEFEAIEAEFRQAQLQFIKGLLSEGNRKEAIKTYRLAFDCSVSEAKKAIDGLEGSP
jgi:hypothetical protein